MSMKFLNTIAVDTDVLYVDTVNDRVGVGTDSPEGNLEISDITQATGATLSITNAHTGSWVTGNKIGSIDFRIDDTSTTEPVRAKIHAEGKTTGTYPLDSQLVFSTTNANTLSESMRITSGGNVGIGTSTPNTALEVDGAISTTTSDYVQGSTGSRLLLETASSGNTHSYIQAQSSGGTTNAEDLALQLYGGNVGIGTSSPSEKLDVSGNIRVTGSFKDSSGDSGTSGQILSSTGSGTTWIDDNASGITGVTAGTGLTGGGTSGTVTLNVIGGSGITANANDIQVDSTVVRTTGSTMTGTLDFSGSGIGRAITITADGGLDGADASIYLGNAPSSYGWDIQYTGSGSGNTNSLDIISTNAGSPVTALKILQDGNATFAGNVDATGNVEARGYLQAFSTFYMRGTTQIMNKAADGFLNFLAKDTSGSETVMNISNVGTLSTSGNATFGDDVTVSGNIDVSGEIIQTSTGNENQFASPLNMGSNKIIDLANPTTAQEAATKAYVDNAVSAPTAPAAPTTVTTAVVGETIEVTFNQSATSNIDYYQVWSADPSGNFGIIAQIAPSDFATTMTVVDTSFNVSGTMSYRVYAVKLGIYSSAATSTQAFSAPALSVTAMTVVNLNTAYYVQYEKPSSRFIDNIEIYMDSQTTQAALNRSNASIVYSGQNASYMRNVGASNNFHQFWVEVTTT